jgi:hypothetical protein
MTSPGARIAAVALASLVAAIGGAALWVVSTPIDVSPLSPPAAAGGVKLAPEVTRAAGRPGAGDTLRETVARPLFAPDRRPPAAEPVAQAAPASAPPVAQTVDLRLVGTMRAGAGWRALLRDPATSDWVSVGGSIGGWRVAEIDAERVVLEGQGRRMELSLYPTR